MVSNELSVCIRLAIVLIIGVGSPSMKRIMCSILRLLIMKRAGINQLGVNLCKLVDLYPWFSFLAHSDIMIVKCDILNLLYN